MAARNGSQPKPLDSRRDQCRNIIIEGAIFLADGVTSRLARKHRRAGGICISSSAHDQVGTSSNSGLSTG